MVLTRHDFLDEAIHTATYGHQSFNRSLIIHHNLQIAGQPARRCAR
jgi:hypothetical protein